MSQKTYNILIINGHPDKESYCNALFDVYKKLTLQFCGVNPVRVTNIGPLRLSKESYRKKWLDKIYQLGLKNK
ncbi:MAG: NAD(P)H-dependent oxidoreductase [Leptospira sp.]|nr:NAD(P)H-dependent oxidoreductase [Leptospira sp.]